MELLFFNPVIGFQFGLIVAAADGAKGAICNLINRGGCNAGWEMFPAADIVPVMKPFCQIRGEHLAVVGEGEPPGGCCIKGGNDCAGIRR